MSVAKWVDDSVGTMVVKMVDMSAVLTEFREAETMVEKMVEQMVAQMVV